MHSGFFLTSCGGGDEKKTSTDTTAQTPRSMTAPSQILLSPRRKI